MKILVLAPTYPYSEFPFSGIFNERCVLALKELCDHVEVLVPRPYVPRFLAIHPRWKTYSAILKYEKRNGVVIHRPPNFQIPRIGCAFWYDYGAYLFCRHYVRKLHHKVKFDVIIAFNLLGVGGLAWRIGKDLKILSCGWATGNDVRVPAGTFLGKVVFRAIKNLDFVFYQSFELLKIASKLANMLPAQMLSENHMVLPRGIPIPPLLPREKLYKNIRDRWRIKDNDLVVLYLGRITREKGIYELLDAISYVLLNNNKITCILVGSMPAFDETGVIKKKIANDPILKNKVKIFPACDPDEIWDVLSAADIFAFTSHKEGMPNSLLEAMAAGLPAVVFAIPPIEELDEGTCSLVKVPPFNSKLFGEAILQLADSPEKRKTIAEKGRRRAIEKFDIKKNMACAIGRINKLLNK